MAKQPVPVTGIWLHAVFNERGEATDKMRVCAEVDGQWRECIVEGPYGHCSHIVEPGGILTSPVVSVPGKPGVDWGCGEGGTRLLAHDNCWHMNEEDEQFWLCHEGRKVALIKDQGYAESIWRKLRHGVNGKHESWRAGDCFWRYNPDGIRLVTNVDNELVYYIRMHDGERDQCRPDYLTKTSQYVGYLPDLLDLFTPKRQNVFPLHPKYATPESENPYGGRTPTPEVQP